MPAPGRKQFEEGKHTVSITLTAAEYAALKKALTIHTKPLSEEDREEIMRDRSKRRRFLRLAIVSVALAAIRAGKMPKGFFAADLRDETQQEYRERVHLTLNPQDVDEEFFGCPTTAVAKADPADFWKGFNRCN